MHWLVWLSIAVLVAAGAAVTGLRPKGARPVAGTHLMAVARVVLVILVALFAYFAYQARQGGWR